MNCGKKVTLKPMKIRKAEIRPQASIYIRPVIFGHQKCRPPRNASTVPPTMM